MKTNNFYTKLVFSVWYFIKKASMAIVSAFPTQKIQRDIVPDSPFLRVNLIVLVIVRVIVIVACRGCLCDE